MLPFSGEGSYGMDRIVWPSPSSSARRPESARNTDAFQASPSCGGVSRFWQRPAAPSPAGMGSRSQKTGWSSQSQFDAVRPVGRMRCQGRVGANRLTGARCNPASGSSDRTLSKVIGTWLHSDTLDSSLSCVVLRYGASPTEMWNIVAPNVAFLAPKRRNRAAGVQPGRDRCEAST